MKHTYIANKEDQRTIETKYIQNIVSKKTRLSIWLDKYDDIFSDFDSSPLSDRVLSDDFLNEAKKIAKEKLSGSIELKLQIPNDLRDLETEEVIIKNLHSYFRRHSIRIEHEMSKIRNTGILISMAGLITLTIATYLVNLKMENIFINTLKITLEPLGLFFVWTGLDRIFYLSHKNKSEMEFTKKMAHSSIHFISY